MADLVEKMADAMLSADAVRSSVRQHLGRNVALKFARACLSAIEAEGMVIVPREPTLQMLEDGCDANNFRMEDVPHVWGAMLALKGLTDEDRLEVFALFCTHCGSDDPDCQCWNDE